jgi:hypothetical protein
MESSDRALTCLIVNDSALVFQETEEVQKALKALQKHGDMAEVQYTSG